MIGFRNEGNRLVALLAVWNPVFGSHRIDGGNGLAEHGGHVLNRHKFR